MSATGCCGQDCAHRPHPLPLCASCGRAAGEECAGCGGQNQRVTLAQVRRWRAIETAARRVLHAGEEYADPKKRTATSAAEYKAAHAALREVMV